MFNLFINNISENRYLVFLNTYKYVIAPSIISIINFTTIYNYDSFTITTTNNLIDLTANIYIIHYTIDLYFSSFIYKLHHIISILCCYIVYNSNYKYPELIFMINNFEISTIFFNLFLLHENIFCFKILFALSFLYYRIYLFYYFYLYDYDNEKFNMICNNNIVCYDSACIIILNTSNYIIMAMNLYWSTIILDEIKKFIINSNFIQNRKSLKIL